MMATAAFIVSVVSAVAALGAAWYVREQASSTARLAELEAERRHLERAPTIEVNRLEPGINGEERFEILNRGPTLCTTS
jgi:hypothetical protein